MATCPGSLENQRFNTSARRREVELCHSNGAVSAIRAQRGGGLINLLEPAPRAGIVGRMVELVEACGVLPSFIELMMNGRGTSSDTQLVALGSSFTAI